MDYVQPVGSVSGDVQGQGAVTAEIVRERYAQLIEQKVKEVEASAEGQSVLERKRKDAGQEQTAPPPVTAARHIRTEFEVDEETHDVTVRMFDADTGALVRTIPPEELAQEIIKSNLVPNRVRARSLFV